MKDIKEMMITVQADCISSSFEKKEMEEEEERVE